MAMFIPADEKQKITGIKPKDGTDFQLEELYRLLDCSIIELVETFTGDLMVIDGDGKEVKPKNVRATEMVPFATVGELKQMLAVQPSTFFFAPDDWLSLPDSAKADYIAGDVIVCKQSEVH